MQSNLNLADIDYQDFSWILMSFDLQNPKRKKFETIMFKVKKSVFKTAFKSSSAGRQKAFWCVQLNFDWFSTDNGFVAKGMSRLISTMSVGYVDTQNDQNPKWQHFYEAKAICSLDKR